MPLISNASLYVIAPTAITFTSQVVQILGSNLDMNTLTTHHIDFLPGSPRAVAENAKHAATPVETFPIIVNYWAPDLAMIRLTIKPSHDSFDHKRPVFVGR